jgi:hypothetical protein
MEKNIPVIGVVFNNGQIESYDYITALKNNFHHSFIMSSQDKKEIDYDSVLRFVRLENEAFYTLEGEPSLDPYTIGKKQITAFAAHCVENGVDPNTRVKIKDHKLGTYYEGRFIGALKDLIK